MCVLVSVLPSVFAWECVFLFFFQAEDGIRDGHVTEVQTCALPISGVRTCRTCEIDKTVFRVFDVADDGTVFMGSYPDASVFSWDPATDEVRDYGPVFTEGQYIWGLTLAGDQLFVGTGNGPGLGQFFQVDTVSGDITRVEYPDEAFTPTVIGELQAVGDIILVPLFGDDHHVRMYDAADGEWVCEDTPASG